MQSFLLFSPKAQALVSHMLYLGPGPSSLLHLTRANAEKPYAGDTVANNFCDMPLPKYIDSKTVLIYRPHPVYTSLSRVRILNE